MTVLRRDTQDQITGMAKVQVGTKLSALLGSPASAVYGWMDDAEAAGVSEQYTEAHYTHLRMRIAETGNPALLDAFNAKMAAPRLSQEQKISDGYRLLDRHYDRTAKNPAKWAEILAMQQAISTDPNFNKLCKVSPRGVTYGCTSKGFQNCVSKSGPPYATLAQTIVDSINSDLGTNIDFTRIAQWEENRLSGYVAWGDGAKGGVNSGVTIAAGVDLGNVSLRDLTSALRLSPPPFPADPFTSKLKPHLQLKKRDACNILSDIPLTITQDEANWLNRWKMKEWARVARDALNQQAQAEIARRRQGLPAEAIPDWPANMPYPAMPLLFNGLSQQAQTVAASRAYNAGYLQEPSHRQMLRAIMYGNYDLARKKALDARPQVPNRIAEEFDYLGS